MSSKIGTCSNCKHWTAPLVDGDEFGACTQATTNDAVLANPRSTMRAMDCSGYHAALGTMAHHFCSMWCGRRSPRRNSGGQ